MNGEIHDLRMSYPDTPGNAGRQRTERAGYICGDMMLIAESSLKRMGAMLLRRGRCWLFLALGFGLFVLRADAAGTSLPEYLRACGIGEEAFANFSDDRQIANEEFDVIRRIALRLHACPRDRLHDMLPKEISTARLPSRQEAKGARGRSVELQGTIVSVESVPDREEEPLWRCVVALAASSAKVVVYVATLPEKIRSHGSGERVASSAVFVKYVPGAVTEPMAVVVAPRLEWRPELPLANLGMDFGLFDGVRDRTPLTAAEYEAFYCLLSLARNADRGRLDREAQRLDSSDAGLPTLHGDPAAKRGRLVTLSGTVRRVVRVPVEDAALTSRLGTDHFFEVDVVPDGLPINHVVFCSLELPEGADQSGPRLLDAHVEVAGFFFKDWEYPTPLSEAEKAAHPGSLTASQTAPLLIGPAPLWKPAAVGRKSSTAGSLAGLVALVIAGVCLLLWHLRKTDQEFSRQVMYSARGRG